MTIPHNKIYHDALETNAVVAVMNSGQWAGGTQVKALEENFSKLFLEDADNHAACVGSGLAALRLSLLALGVRKGDEVIIPAYCCVALANAVLSVGAIPVCVDIEAIGYNINPLQIEKNISEKTKAIIVVNSFGVPNNIEALQKFNIPVIEDCSHGFEVGKNNAPASIKSDIAIFSFYATKLIAGGEGGLVLAQDKKRAEFCRNYRDYTDQAPDGLRLNDKMTDIEAAIVRVQMDKLSDILSLRQAAAQRYEAIIPDSQFYQKPNASAQGRVWYRYALRLEQGVNIDSIIDKMESCGITVRKPIENWMGREISNYPQAAQAYKRVLSLPLYAAIEEADQIKVVKNLMRILDEQ